MQLDLAKEVVLVTGGGQGVGRRLCLDFAAEGAKVIVNDLFSERCEAVVREITQQGGQAIAAAADITEAHAVNTMIDEAERHFGPVTVLVNNAGVIPERRAKGGIPPLFHETDQEGWEKIINLNIYGTLHCCHRVIPAMRAARHGKIISIMSEAGRIGEARLAVYAGAKAAILGFSKSIARELARDCINVNVVSLGAISHEGIRSGPLAPDATPETDERLAKMIRAYPISRGLQRLARPEDVSAMVLLLASGKGAFITGQSVGVSGGFAMP